MRSWRAVAARPLQELQEGFNRHVRCFCCYESKILVHVLAQWGTVHLILESLSHATHRERDTAVSLTLSGEGGSLEPIRNEDHASLSNARLSTGAARLGGRTPPRAGVRKRDFQNGGSVQV